MRRGNLPDTCHDNVISKRSRDQLTKRRNNVTRRRGGDAPKWCYWVFHLETPQTCTNGTSWIRTTETPRWRTTEASIVVSFETCLRRTDVTVLLRRLNVPMRHRGDVPQWDVFATFHRDVVGCPIWDIPVTSLGRKERRLYDVATMSCCRVESIALPNRRLLLLYQLLLLSKDVDHTF